MAREARPPGRAPAFCDRTAIDGARSRLLAWTVAEQASRFHVSSAPIPLDPPLDRCNVSFRISVPLSNLRAVVIVVVVAFHSVLPYLASLPAHPFPFDVAPYRWIAFPIIDRERWFGFDLFCAWQDISLMSLMFFLAGLFTPSGLGRKGSLTYLLDRWWRIGLPFLFAGRVLTMPLRDGHNRCQIRDTSGDPRAAFSLKRRIGSLLRTAAS